jgi:hypothetical protein
MKYIGPLPQGIAFRNYCAVHASVGKRSPQHIFGDQVSQLSPDQALCYIGFRCALSEPYNVAEQSDTQQFSTRSSYQRCWRENRSQTHLVIDPIFFQQEFELLRTHLNDTTGGVVSCGSCFSSQFTSI